MIAMANSYKRTLPLAEVVPSGSNPRRDMGDIGALARSIEATGGQPVQPLVVVADGNRWRVVDGERRLLAMRALYGDSPAAVVDCVVFTDYGDAEEAVAMMATDSKRPLSDEERGRGFQRMLRLDVPDETVSAVVGTDVARVRRARRIVRDTGLQTSMGAMLAAAADGLTEEDRVRVLAAENPEREAEAALAGHRREADLAETGAVLADAGVGLVHACAPADQEGLIWLANVHNVIGARAFATEHAGEADMVAYHLDGRRAVWQVFSRMDPADLAATTEAARRAERQRTVEDHMYTYGEAMLAAASWAFDSLQAATTGLPAFRDPLPKNLCALVRGMRQIGDDHVGEGSDMMEAAAESVPSLWEVYAACEGMWSAYGILDPASLDVEPGKAAAYAALHDALVADGWDPSPEASELRAMCGDDVATGGVADGV